MSTYIIYCTTNGETFGQHDSEERAHAKAKHHAERNVGNEYLVAKGIKSYKCTYEGVKLEEADMDGSE